MENGKLRQFRSSRYEQVRDRRRAVNALLSQRNLYGQSPVLDFRRQILYGH